MKQWTVTTLAMLLWCVAVPVGRAQWGWPPPGYSVAGMRSCDGCRYRGLREVLRDRRWRSSGCNPTPEATLGAKPSEALQNSEDSPLPQPAPVSK
jgi:hypothetical protein